MVFACSYPFFALTCALRTRVCSSNACRASSTVLEISLSIAVSSLLRAMYSLLGDFPVELTVVVDIADPAEVVARTPCCALLPDIVVDAGVS